MTTFEQRWKAMPLHAEGFQRVDDLHPLDFYLGKDVTGEWLLLLVSKENVISSRQHHAIHIISRQRSDGRWALLFRLMKPELGKVFALLCEDLVESCRNNPDPAHPASFVLARFSRWQRLLDRGSTGLLDEATLRGLLGELLFLEMVLLPSKGDCEAVKGWVGPKGADRDFRFADQEFEVKAVRPGAVSVIVSSAEQLDLREKRLDLVVVTIDEAGMGKLSESFTPLNLVRRLRERFEIQPGVLEEFDSRLMEAGFLAREEYAENVYVLNDIRTFHVSGDFPAIRRSCLPAGIGRVNWELSLQAILPFEVNTSTN